MWHIEYFQTLLIKEISFKNSVELIHQNHSERLGSFLNVSFQFFLPEKWESGWKDWNKFWIENIENELHLLNLINYLNFVLIYDVNRVSRKNLLTENWCECLLFTLVNEFFACECEKNLSSYEAIVCRRRRRRLLGLVRDDDGPMDAKENNIYWAQAHVHKYEKWRSKKKNCWMLQMRIAESNSFTAYTRAHVHNHTARIDEIVFHTINICICKHRQRATKNSM